MHASSASACTRAQWWPTRASCNPTRTPPCAIAGSSAPTSRSSPTCTASTPLLWPPWTSHSTRAISHTAGSRTASSCPATPPVSSRRSTTSSACAARCRTFPSSWAAASPWRRPPSCCRWRTRSSSAPPSSATATWAIPSTPSACGGWSTPLASSLRGGALALAALALAACASAPPADVLARLEPRLGQLLLVGFRGTTLTDNAELDALLCGARTGGILLFARNIVDATQVAALTAASAARAAECGTAPLLVAVDAEGGRVMRLSPAAGYVATLSHKDLGDGNDLVLTELEARRIGAMLREAGINWNLAPVVDVGYNPANPVIVGSGRSFSANPALVAAQARAFITGLRSEGVLSALKHFPGHGSSFADSHQGFVDVTDTANPILELAPYRLLFAEHAVDSVMTAHVFNRYLDSRYPATLSRR